MPPPLHHIVRQSLPACLIVALFAATPCHAGDYERNDVAGRELGAFVGILPADLDPRPQGPCPKNNTQTCRFVTLPLAMAVRGAARRHVRGFYLGTEIVLGASLPAAPYGSSLVVGGGGMIGVESADDSFKRFRAYAEMGIELMSAGTKVGDWLHIFLEGGMRYQTQTFQRPHSYLFTAVRALNNFNHFGLGLTAGMGWTFD